MHRDSITQQLMAYQAKWTEESATAEQLVAFISSFPACFERTLHVGHVTGSAWVVNQAGTHVLLTHHRKLNKWLQLGGHADGDSDILRVAQREVQEESGLDRVAPLSNDIFDIDIHLIPERGSDPAHYHYDIRYAMQCCGSERYVVSADSHDLSWIKITELNQVTEEESMLRMAAKWKGVCYE